MSRSFNGTSDYIDCGGGSGSLDFADNSVVAGSCWVLFNSLASDRQIFSKGFDTHNTAYELQISGGTQLFWGSYNGSTHGAGWTFGGGLSTGQWYHIYCDYDGSTWHLYVNGVSKATSVDAVGPLSTVRDFCIGCVDAPSAGGFIQLHSGNIADVCLWGGITLSAGEIASLVAGARPFNIRRSSIKGYWPLDGIASTEPDLSSFAHNGTLNGTAKAGGPPISMFTPRKNNAVLPTTSPSFIASWARGSNLPVLGTGTY